MHRHNKENSIYHRTNTKVYKSRKTDLIKSNRFLHYLKLILRIEFLGFIVALAASIIAFAQYKSMLDQTSILKLQTDLALKQNEPYFEVIKNSTDDHVSLNVSLVKGYATRVSVKIYTYISLMIYDKINQNIVEYYSEGLGIDEFTQLIKNESYVYNFSPNLNQFSRMEYDIKQIPSDINQILNESQTTLNMHCFIQIQYLDIFDNEYLKTMEQSDDTITFNSSKINENFVEAKGTPISNLMDMALNSGAYFAHPLSTYSPNELIRKIQKVNLDLNSIINYQHSLFQKHSYIGDFLKSKYLLRK